MCWGHPNNHEHSDFIQKWTWDMFQEAEQSSLLIEGLCIQLVRGVLAEDDVSICSQACWLMPR